MNLFEEKRWFVMIVKIDFFAKYGVIKLVSYLLIIFNPLVNTLIL